MAADPVARLNSGELTLEEEIAIAFKNIETTLLTVDGSGWSEVYRVNSYHTQLTPEVMEVMVKNFRKYMPGHQPLWTATGAHQLAAPGMRIEIEVVALKGAGNATQGGK